MTARMRWMDDNIFGDCLVNSVDEVVVGGTFNIFPNPANDHLSISYTSPKTGDVEIQLLDVLGKVVWDYRGFQAVSGKQKVNVIMDDWRRRAGVYFLELRVGGDLIGIERVVF